MGYTTNPQMVRVDIWKGLKWYTTLELDWNKYSAGNGGVYEHIRDTFKRLMDEQYPGQFKGMKATCLEPYHEEGYPLMIEL